MELFVCLIDDLLQLNGKFNCGLQICDSHQHLVRQCFNYISRGEQRTWRNPLIFIVMEAPSHLQFLVITYIKCLWDCSPDIKCICNQFFFFLIYLTQNIYNFSCWVLHEHEHNDILYEWGFSQVSNFSFIRDSHQSAKKRIRVNFHPLLHKYLYFLK